MSENYEVVYTHPSGATATFIRHDGELDALAKALDAEQFWVFKNVKALLVRNDEGDLADANRLMAQIGFTATVRELVTPQAVAVAEPVFAVEPAEAHAGPHLPGPSYWPLLLAASVTLALGSWLASSLFITIPLLLIGLVCVLISMVNWGLEPI
ncbi:MAG: hypothetical protein ACXVDA_10395 [Ktedonobacterales bacterium]